MGAFWSASQKPPMTESCCKQRGPHDINGKIMLDQCTGIEVRSSCKPPCLRRWRMRQGVIALPWVAPCALAVHLARCRSVTQCLLCLSNARRFTLLLFAKCEYYCWTLCKQPALSSSLIVWCTGGASAVTGSRKTRGVPLTPRRSHCCADQEGQQHNLRQGLLRLAPAFFNKLCQPAGMQLGSHACEQESAQLNVVFMDNDILVFKSLARIFETEEFDYGCTISDSPIMPVCHSTRALAAWTAGNSHDHAGTCAAAGCCVWRSLTTLLHRSCSWSSTRGGPSYVAQCCRVPWARVGHGTLGSHKRVHTTVRSTHDVRCRGRPRSEAVSVGLLLSPVAGLRGHARSTLVAPW